MARFSPQLRRKRKRGHRTLWDGQKVMRKSVTTAITISVLVVLTVALVEWYRSANFRLQSVSPDNAVSVKGLPFKGTAAHPLDGDLRIYVDGDSASFASGVWQTTIPWDRNLAITWQVNSDLCFVIERNGRELIRWRINDENVECIAGCDFVTYDPHLLWRTTGEPTPSKLRIKAVGDRGAE